MPGLLLFTTYLRAMSEPKKDEPGVRRIKISDSLYVMVSGKGYMLEAVNAEQIRKHFKAQHIPLSKFAEQNDIGADTAARQFKDGSLQMEFLENLQNTLSGVGGQLIIVMPPIPQPKLMTVVKVIKAKEEKTRVVRRKEVVMVRRSKRKPKPKRKSRKLTKEQLRMNQTAYKIAVNEKRRALGLEPMYKLPATVVAGIDLEELAARAAQRNWAGSRGSDSPDK